MWNKCPFYKYKHSHPLLSLLGLVVDHFALNLKLPILQDFLDNRLDCVVVVYVYDEGVNVILKLAIAGRSQERFEQVEFELEAKLCVPWASIEIPDNSESYPRHGDFCRRGRVPVAPGTRTLCGITGGKEPGKQILDHDRFRRDCSWMLKYLWERLGSVVILEDWGPHRSGRKLRDSMRSPIPFDV